MVFQRTEADHDTSRQSVAKWPHILGGSVVIFLFYVFASLTLLLLCGWVALAALAGSLGGSLRWAIGARRSFRRHFEALQALLRSLRLRKHANTSVPISVEDAPELFSMLESLCFLLKMATAPAVFLEMDAGASFQHGGRITLGIGFDLLAGATRSELEAVLAHELCHASLPRWIMRRWLAHGLERGLQLSSGLSRLCPLRGRRDNSPSLASALLQVTNRLVEAAAWHVRAFSLQEELEADRRAAVIFGREAFRDTLLKVESLSRFSARLSWPERVAQLQTQTLSAWLAQEFSRVKPVTVAELSAQVPDGFSTHPSLSERLAALPLTEGTLTQTDSRPAISLLANPDALAERLFARVLETTVEEEERDTRKLRQWIKETRAAKDLRPVQLCGATLVFAAAMTGAAAWSVGTGPLVLATIWGTLAVGLLFFQLGRYRERFTLPLPDFGLLKHTWDTDRAVSEDELKQMEAVCVEQVAGKSPKKARPILANKCFDALSECDYPKGAVAAQMLLARQPDSLGGWLTSAITLAWRGDGAAADAIAAVQRKNGLKGPSLCWGMAWAFMFRGQWGRAEALLEQVIDQHPSDPTLLNLRALCQARRGKIQSAIHNARRACEPRPKNIEHVKFLIGLLLDGGYVREAQARLVPLHDQIAADHELMMLAARINLSLRNFAGAEGWSQALIRESAPA
jgi:Zn-dependent protease with chaperone function